MRVPSFVALALTLTLATTAQAQGPVRGGPVRTEAASVEAN
mgnify:FL=1